MNEKDFNEMFKNHEECEEKRTNTIQKRIGKNIYQRVVIVLVVIVLIVMGLMQGTSLIFDFVNYNPLQEKALIVADEYAAIKDETFHIVFQTYCDIYFPGISYLPQGDIESLGFGKYETKVKIHHLFNRLYVDGSTNVTLKIDQSHMSMETDENHIFSRVIDEFLNESLSRDKSSLKLNKQTLTQIKELPDSARLNVSIAFPEAYSLEKTIQFMNHHEDMSCHWMAIDKLNTKDNLANGISLWKMTQYDFLPEIQKKYSHFNLGDTDSLTPEILQQYYLSNLQLLLDHPQEVNMIAEMLSSSGGGNTYDIQEIYEHVRNGFEVIGLRMSVGKKELLKIIDEENIDYLYIDDVKLSLLQK